MDEQQNDDRNHTREEEVRMLTLAAKAASKIMTIGRKNDVCAGCWAIEVPTIFIMAMAHMLDTDAKNLMDAVQDNLDARLDDGPDFDREPRTLH